MNRLCFAFALLTLHVLGAGKPRENESANPKRTDSILWRDPTDLTTRNLIYGIGGKEHEPHGPFTFVKEDLDGTNPKFVATDSDGVKWKVKLGVEAQPETAAARLVWAVGYMTNEDYFLPDIQVRNLPPALKRGQKEVQPGGNIFNVRLKRDEKKEEQKIGTWKWRENPFTGTRELNGLRVMMAMINNWDLKDANNAIYQEGKDGPKVYMVSDLGASFGSTGLGFSHADSKGNLEYYSRSEFLSKVTPLKVDFIAPTRPNMITVFNPHEFISRVDMRWIGKQIPRADVTWIASILARLSPAQIRDAFRAAGYSPEDVEGFAAVVERRIFLIKKL